MGHQRDYSEELAEKVDLEVRALIEQAHDEAYAVLNDEPRHPRPARRASCIEKETLDHDQLAEIFADVKKLDERPQWLSSKRSADQRPAPDRLPEGADRPGAVDGGVDSDASVSRPKRAPRPRKNPGIATA